MRQDLSENDAVNDFYQARRQATLQAVMTRFTGKSTKLLSFNDLGQNLMSSGSLEKGTQDIPLEAIVGSCGRYEDFNRTFLPLQNSDQERWTKVQAYIKRKGIANIPPIAVYQIGNVYFVSDGNHRISVARRMGVAHIRANVTELQSKVALSPDDEPDELILKSEYADFLARSGLDEGRPVADLRLTVPGKYWILEAQIEAHCFLASGDSDEQVSFQEGALFWYDSVYSGVVQLIQDRGLLRDFPHRTEADFYVWVFEHRAKLRQVLEWDLGVGTVLNNFKGQSHPVAERIRRVKNKIIPGQLVQNRSKTGYWQIQKTSDPEHSRLFFNVLVAITGDDPGWLAFEQGVEIARREQGRLQGLHIVSSEAERSHTDVQALQAQFNERCRVAGITGKLSIEAGQPVAKICQRSSLADLVVASLLHPPGSNLMSRLNSEFRTLVQRSARPMLAVPDQPSQFSRALLAYDGSPKARESLFVAAYLSNRWNMPLVVLTVSEGKSRHHAIEDEAKAYLVKHRLQPLFVQKNGSVVTAILETTEEQGADLIIMGGYSRRLVKDLVLGDSVDEILNQSKQPVLICR